MLARFVRATLSRRPSGLPQWPEGWIGAGLAADQIREQIETPNGERTQFALGAAREMAAREARGASCCVGARRTRRRDSGPQRRNLLPKRCAKLSQPCELGRLFLFLFARGARNEEANMAEDAQPETERQKSIKAEREKIQAGRARRAARCLSRLHSARLTRGLSAGTRPAGRQVCAP